MNHLGSRRTLRSCCNTHTINVTKFYTDSQIILLNVAERIFTIKTDWKHDSAVATCDCESSLSFSRAMIEGELCRAVYFTSTSVEIVSVTAAWGEWNTVMGRVSKYDDDNSRELLADEGNKSVSVKNTNAIVSVNWATKKEKLLLQPVIHILKLCYAKNKSSCQCQIPCAVTQISLA